jgi:hypothetical protein
MQLLWIISTDEDPGLRIESFAVINLRGVSTNKTVIYFESNAISDCFYVGSCYNIAVEANAPSLDASFLAALLHSCQFH